MTKNNKVNSFLSKSNMGSIRKAIFDQRKSDYLERTHDRPTVFVDKSSKHVNFTR